MFKCIKQFLIQYSMTFATIFSALFFAALIVTCILGICGVPTVYVKAAAVTSLVSFVLVMVNTLIFSRS